MRTLWIAAGVAAIFAIVWLIVSSGAGVPVEAAKAARGPVREYIDEEAKTRLAQTYLITAPYDGRVEAIALAEGAPVHRGDVVARVVPLDTELTVDAARAAVDRLEAAIKENDDISVESTGLEQAINFATSMDRTVDAAAARVRAGEAKREYGDKYLARAERMFANKSMAENELDQARVNQVQSDVDHEQDVLVLRATEALRAATALMPTVVRQYILRKNLKHDVLEKELAEARVALRQTERDQARGVMTSPVDGVVLERIDTNERTFSVGTALVKIGSWDDLEVEAEVLTQEATAVKPGAPVEISGPAIGPTPVAAKVSRVYPAGFTKISSLGVEQQRVKVVMRFAPETLASLRGERDLGVDYRVRARIFTAESSDGLVIPRSALFRGADGDWRVFAIDGGRAQIREVKVGLTNDDQAEIKAGLEEHDEVILAPETNLADGLAVRPVGRP